MRGGYISFRLFLNNLFRFSRFKYGRLPRSRSVLAALPSQFEKIRQRQQEAPRLGNECERSRNAKRNLTLLSDSGLNLFSPEVCGSFIHLLKMYDRLDPRVERRLLSKRQTGSSAV